MNEEQMNAIGALGSGYSDLSAPAASAPAANPAGAVISPSQRSSQASEPTPVSSTAAGPPSDAQVVASAVARANANLAAYGRVMDFSVDAATGLTIARIRNSQTGQVLQQFPSEDLVRLAQMLADWSPGSKLRLDLMA